jgi:hypothetical protein
MTKTKWLILLAVLVLGAAACSMRPNNPDPSLPRRSGECTDPRFKEAELEAFQTMLQERDAATKAFDNEIGRIEQVYKEALLKKRSDYNKALNQCKDATCTANAKADYDRYIEREQISHEAQIQIAEDNEQLAIEQAQDKYNQAVNEAREKYCPKSYRASGSEAEATYEGVICSLAESFQVTVTSPYYQFTIDFTPSNTLIGLFTYGGTWYDVGAITGDGAYSVTYDSNGINATQLVLNTAHTTHTIIGPVQGDPGFRFNLFPLETNECSQ